MKILLVDDQREVLDGLRRLLTESFDDIEIIEAYDGSQGYMLALHTQPNVIIADIMMADVDGLQMIRRLKKDGIKSKMIILSAHERFDYAKQAIELGVDDYIVKPVTRRQIYLAVVKQLRCIENSHARDLYCDVLLNEYLSGADIFISEETVFEMSGLSDMDKPYWMIGLFKSDQIRTPHFLAGLLTKMEARLKELGFQGYLYHTYGRCIFAIVNLSKEGAVEGAAVLMRLYELLPEGYFSGASSLGESLASLCTLYHQAEMAAEHARAMAMPFIEYSSTSGEGAIIGNDAVDKLITAIGERDQAAAWTVLDQQLAGLTLQGISVDSCKAELTSLIRALDAYFCPDASDLRDILVKMDAEKGLFGLKRIIHERMLKWLSQRPQSHHYPPGIQAAADYIDAHLSENLTVAQLANVANLSYYYFSALFTRATGTTVKEYLQNRRLDRAAELMKSDVTLRVGEIAKRCGFSNVHYFSSSFKKKFLLTPQQYRALRNTGR